MNKVYILLGSNLKNPSKQVDIATKHIQKLIGEVKRTSALYETAAWGNTNQPNFLNQVLVVHTNYDAQKILTKILAIEQKMGRIRTTKNAPRIIDIDIIFFNKEIIKNKDLIIPHPLLQQRKFVLIPLNELSPQFKHPILNKTIHQLLPICKDDLKVTKIDAK
jgi:2-amino-4-hydroxy-6-hydroxymethyldihydropteridine diphosphokinase